MSKKKLIQQNKIDTEKITYEIMCNTFEFLQFNTFINKNKEKSFNFDFYIDKILPGKIIIDNQIIILKHPTLIMWSILMTILDNKSTIKLFKFGYINNHCYIKSI